MNDSVSPMVRKIVEYFERPGPVNTNKVIQLCRKRAMELKVKHVVVASLTGG